TERQRDRETEGRRDGEKSGYRFSLSLRLSVSPSLTPPLRSEFEPSDQLNDARRERSGQSPEIGAIDVENAAGAELLRPADAEVGAVEQIERLDAQLKAARFCHLDVLDDRSVPADCERPVYESSFERPGLARPGIEEDLAVERRRAESLGRAARPL